MEIAQGAATLASRVGRKLQRTATTVSLRSKLRKDTRFLPEDPGQVDIILNFPDGLTNLYQIRQWYGPLEYINQFYKVAILCYLPESAMQIAQETDLKVILTPSFTDLSEVENVLRPKTILYPNQNYANYRILSLPESEHVFISHGESDKIYMASNWVKVFNYFFIAGQASHDRLKKHIRNYEVDERTMRVGRPQIDIPTEPPIEKPAGRITVLYAPTWEGGRATMRYGSVASHGLAIVNSLLNDPRFQIIYRPHPRTGIHLPEVEQADKTIRARLDEANQSDPGAQHIVDSTPFGWQVSFADFMITDVSAVAYDWLTTAKPLLITRPVEPQTVMPDTGYLAQTPLLHAVDAANAPRLVNSMLDDPMIRKSQEKWADYYYGDRSRGESLARFKSALEATMDEIDDFRGVHAPSHEFAAGGFTTPHNKRSVDESTAGIFFVLKRKLRKLAVSLADQLAAEAAATSIDVSLASASTGRTSRVLVSCMAECSELDNLLDWLPALEQINKRSPVAILTGNLRTFRRLSKLTRLRLFVAYSAADTEAIVQSLNPDLVLHFEQSKLNLREATLRTALHVYIGEQGDESWINNRLRLFDTILIANDEQRSRIERSLVAFPATVRLQNFLNLDRADVIGNLALSAEGSRPLSPKL